jgi:hypothetical protein
VLEFFSKENVISIIRPVFEPGRMPLVDPPNWIAGFVQADGTFGLNYTKQVRIRLGYTSQPQFRVYQHQRDLIVLKRIIATMGCGTLVKPTGDRDIYNISVANLKYLLTIVRPFFVKYPIYGAKFLDYMDFFKGVTIIENKGHLAEG